MSISKDSDDDCISTINAPNITVSTTDFVDYDDSFTITNNISPGTSINISPVNTGSFTSPYTTTTWSPTTSPRISMDLDPFLEKLEILIEKISDRTTEKENKDDTPFFVDLGQCFGTWDISNIQGITKEFNTMLMSGGRESKVKHFIKLHFLDGSNRDSSTFPSMEDRDSEFSRLTNILVNTNEERFGLLRSIL